MILCFCKNTNEPALLLCFLWMSCTSIFTCQPIHQFDIRGFLFATGSGHELGVKEPCQLFVYNSDSACEVEKATKFDESLKFSQVLLLVYVVSYHGNSSSTYFALSDNVYRYIWLVFSGLPCCVCLFACAPLVSSWSTGIVQSLIA